MPDYANFNNLNSMPVRNSDEDTEYVEEINPTTFPAAFGTFAPNLTMDVNPGASNLFGMGVFNGMPWNQPHIGYGNHNFNSVEAGVGAMGPGFNVFGCPEAMPSMHPPPVIFDNFTASSQHFGSIGMAAPRLDNNMAFGNDPPFAYSGNADHGMASTTNNFPLSHSQLQHVPTNFGLGSLTAPTPELGPAASGWPSDGWNHLDPPVDGTLVNPHQQRQAHTTTSIDPRQPAVASLSLTSRAQGGLSSIHCFPITGSESAVSVVRGTPVATPSALSTTNTSQEISPHHAQKLSATPNTCLHCLLVCDTAQSLKDHTKQTGHKPWTCTCGMTFSRQYALRRHDDTATTKDELQKFNCPRAPSHCDRHGLSGFSRKSHVSQHLRYAHRYDRKALTYLEKPLDRHPYCYDSSLWVCHHDGCWKHRDEAQITAYCKNTLQQQPFKNPALFELHMSHMHGEYPYSCTFPNCRGTKAFKTVNAFRSHVRKVHGPEVELEPERHEDFMPWCDKEGCGLRLVVASGRRFAPPWYCTYRCLNSEQVQDHSGVMIWRHK